jgi:hypothetical protein
MRLFRAIGRLNEDKNTPLTAEQAKKVLAVMKPLRTQPKLTPEQAEETYKKLEAILTDAQRKAIEQAARERWQSRSGDREPRPGGENRAPGNGGPGADRRENGDTNPRQQVERGQNDGNRDQEERRGPEQRPAAGANGGQPGAGGNPRGRFNREEMANFNPFNSQSDNPMAQRMSERMNAEFDALEARAKGK